VPKSKTIISTVNDLEKRFLFVENETLKKNLAINLQYIIFLIQQEEENDLPGTITYSIYKNLILYTTSIIEGLLIHTFKELLEKGKISPKSLKSIRNFKNIKEIYKIDSTSSIISGTLIKGHEKFTRRTSFHDVIKASKKAKIIDAKLLDKIDDLRQKRNKIHLAGLNIVDDYYSKKEVDDVFDLTQKFTIEVESLLNSDD